MGGPSFKTLDQGANNWGRTWVGHIGLLGPPNFYQFLTHFNRQTPIIPIGFIPGEPIGLPLDGGAFGTEEGN